MKPQMPEHRRQKAPKQKSRALKPKVFPNLPEATGSTHSIKQVVINMTYKNTENHFGGTKGNSMRTLENT